MPLPLNENLKKVKAVLYDVLDLHISNLINEPEGKEYDACQFDLNGRKLSCISAKITPKIVGQFVTFWQRNSDGIT
jgi:hypothetical protein